MLGLSKALEICTTKYHVGLRWDWSQKQEKILCAIDFICEINSPVTPAKIRFLRVEQIIVFKIIINRILNALLEIFPKNWKKRYYSFQQVFDLPLVFER